MNLDEIEDLIRRYLSAGVAVVIILVAPATGDAAGDPAGDPSGESTVVTVDPEPTNTEPRVVEPRTVEPRTVEPRTVEPGSEDGDEPEDEPEDEEPAPTVRDSPPYADPEDETPADEAEADETSTDDGSTSDEPTDDRSEPDREASEGVDAELDARGPADGSEPGLDDSDTNPVDRGSTSEGVTAAERHGWGTPTQEDDFTADLSRWELYDGPGHAGEGRRSSTAVTVENGVLTITGDTEGTTGGMAWDTGQRYGRWEGRARAAAADPSYNALLLLWPDAEDFPVGGQVDFMEMIDPTRQETDFFLHFGEDDDQITSQVQIDGTEWHNWAVEWTPDAITGYVDGEEWFRSTDPSTFPPGPMHLCIQLDWFPEGPGEVQESTMEVEWVRQYTLDDAPATPTTRERVATEPASSPTSQTQEPDPLLGMFAWG